MKTETIAYIQRKLDHAKETRDRLADKIRKAIDAGELYILSQTMERLEIARGEAEYYEAYITHLENPNFFVHLIGNLTEPLNDRYSGRGNDLVRAYNDGRKNALAVLINIVMTEMGIQ